MTSVVVLMGSPRDADKMQPASDVLRDFDVDHEVQVLSAHRQPAEVAALAASARERGIAVFICGAGLAAHLAGAVAANTTVPVIGVPLSGGIAGGLDAMLSTVQMPRGVPVATVAVDGAANAAVLAVEILALTDERLAGALADLRARGGR